MSENITLTMIKPSAVAAGFAGPILKMFQEGGFRIVAMKYLKMTAEEAGAFYEVHKEKGFYHSLVAFMSSGPIIAIVLEKENAVEEFRKFIGATDPDKAEPGTVRKVFGTSLTENAVHGSDSDENATLEAAFFFSRLERF
ncbi:MAG: nucleoside-diphosphate kinase [Bacteroidetes bacterium]|nr:nucleoside-diphosphate kinase [Bacteroidota bacterium]